MTWLKYVDPAVLETARAVARPGQRITIVSSRALLIVNRPGRDRNAGRVTVDRRSF